MKNEERIKEIIKSRGFSRMMCRDTWFKDSWTIRIYGQDIEIYDSEDKTGYYYIGNIDSINITPILDEVDSFIK